MNIGVAIVTYNSARDIARCIASVTAEGVRDIVVVDSASEDATVLELSRLDIPHKVLGENKGFGYAANRAAEMLNTEYVLFLNPDAVLIEGSIKNLIKTVQDNAQAGIIGMLLCDASGTPERMAYGDEPSVWRIMIRRLQHKKPGISPFFTDWVSGGAFLIRKTLFEHLGGFDEEFFLYWEDVDLCRRAREKGFKVLIDPTAKVMHVRGGSNLPDTEKTTIYDQSADRYFKKHYAWAIWAIQRFLRRLYRS